MFGAGVGNTVVVLVLVVLVCVVCELLRPDFGTAVLIRA